MRTYFVYIMANAGRRIYVGVTNDLRRRVFQHKTGFYRNSFTDSYLVDRLVYHETHASAREACAREKTMKQWRRSRKVRLVEAHNLGWLDLAVDWFPALRSRARSARSRHTGAS